MGGFGSGRLWRKNIKTTARYPQLDVRVLYHKDLLKPGQIYTRNWYDDDKEKTIAVHIITEMDKLMLLHRDKRGQDHCYGINLSWTACNYGGNRPWFICPVKKCTQRVAKLYLVATFFACRHCYKLIYFSQLQTPEDRAIQRADNIRAQLGWEPGILNGHEDKPKGMHRETFNRLISDHDDYVIMSMVKIQRIFLNNERDQCISNLNDFTSDATTAIHKQSLPCNKTGTFI